MLYSNLNEWYLMMIIMTMIVCKFIYLVAFMNLNLTLVNYFQNVILKALFISFFFCFFNKTKFSLINCISFSYFVKKKIPFYFVEVRFSKSKTSLKIMFFWIESILLNHYRIGNSEKNTKDKFVNKHFIKY